MTPIQKHGVFPATSPQGHKPQTVINLFTQPVSCSNFYQSCGESNCRKQSRPEAHEDVQSSNSYKS